LADPVATLDSWPAIAIGITAAVAGALVPINAFVKTMLDYRLEAMKAEHLKPETARDIVSTAGGAVFDSMAISDLTAAVKGLTAAIAAGTASDQARHAQEVEEVQARIAAALEQLAEREAPPTRPGRR
jgi:ATP-dependent protease ClpP protease subunit